MTLALLYYILMLLWLLAIAGSHFFPKLDRFTPDAIPFFLFLILGWKVFGSPIHG